MSIKEGTCWDELQVYESDASLNPIPEPNITLQVNWNLNQNLEKNKI